MHGLKKSERKYLFTLIIIAVLSTGLMSLEPVLKKYGGWDWLVYDQLDILFAPVLFLIWLIWVRKGITLIQMIFYPILFLTYLSLTFMWVIAINSQFTIDFHPYNPISTIDQLSNYFLLILFPFLTVLWNYFFSRAENRKLTRKNLYYLFISTFLIPVIIWIFYLIQDLTGIIISKMVKPDLYLQIKNGYLFTAIMFTYILYEGIFFLWVKEKISFHFLSEFKELFIHSNHHAKHIE